MFLLTKVLDCFNSSPFFILHFKFFLLFNVILISEIMLTHFHNEFKVFRFDMCFFERGTKNFKSALFEKLIYDREKPSNFYLNGHLVLKALFRTFLILKDAFSTFEAAS